MRCGQAAPRRQENEFQGDPIDYADGLVRVGVQSAIAHPQTANVLRDLMLKAGLTPPPEGRTLESLCIVEVCKPGYEPVSIND